MCVNLTNFQMVLFSVHVYFGYKFVLDKTVDEEADDEPGQRKFLLQKIVREHTLNVTAPTQEECRAMALEMYNNNEYGVKDHFDELTERRETVFETEKEREEAIIYHVKDSMFPDRDMVNAVVERELGEGIALEEGGSCCSDHRVLILGIELARLRVDGNAGPDTIRGCFGEFQEKTSTRNEIMDATTKILWVDTTKIGFMNKCVTPSAVLLSIPDDCLYCS